MGLYNMIFGQSVNGTTLLGFLGLQPGDFYRFRDCYLSKDKEIAVYTRGGGGNRECYCDDDTTHEAGCVVPTQDRNRQHPCYLRDEDDDYDCTYATFYFRVPAEADRSALAAIEPEIARSEAWAEFISALHSQSTPNTRLEGR